MRVILFENLIMFVIDFAMKLAQLPICSKDVLLVHCPMFGAC